MKCSWLLIADLNTLTGSCSVKPQIDYIVFTIFLILPLWTIFPSLVLFFVDQPSVDYSCQTIRSLVRHVLIYVPLYNHILHHAPIYIQLQKKEEKERDQWLEWVKHIKVDGEKK